MTYTVEFPGLGILLNLNTVAFKIAGFSVYWYGVIIGIGFLLGVSYAFSRCKNMNIDIDKFYDLIIIGFIAAVVCARLYYVVFYPGDLYKNNLSLIFNIRDGGLGIYGGIIGAFLFPTIYAKIKKISILPMLDVTAVGFLIGQGIGRWANFINQEAFGYATDMPWGMISENTIEVVGLQTVHPCFFYESMLCLIGALGLHFFNEKFRRYDGQGLLLYVVWYGVVRFIVEGLRTDSLMIPVIDVRVSQAVALLSVAVAVFFLIKFRKRTALSGCGNKDIMDANGIVTGMAVKEKVKKAKKPRKSKNQVVMPKESTIFTENKTEEEEDTDVQNN